MSDHNDRTPAFQVGQLVTTATGRAAIVRSVTRRGEIEVEALPWKASFRPEHLRPASPRDGELVFLNVEAASESGEEPEA